MNRSSRKAGEQLENLGPSLRRLFGQLAPERKTLVAVVVLAVAGILMSVAAPKILGRGTDIIFAGMIGQHLTTHLSRSQIVVGLNASGQSTAVNIIPRMDVIPSRGIDFVSLGKILMLAIGLYITSSVVLWMQGALLNGAVQRAVYAMRNEVESKIHRIPLSYFDTMARGEILSRATSDIDNVSQSLQHAFSQVLISLLTVVGVTVMTISVSPILASIVLVMIPIVIVVTHVIAKQSQKKFVSQWKNTGQLNAQVEEAFSGHTLVKVFGRAAEVETAFAEKNQELYAATFGGHFISGLILPVVLFIGNLNYAVIAVLGGLRVASGTMSLGDVQAIIQYSRMFTQPLSQLAAVASLLQSGVASAERVFELLDVDEQSADGAEVLNPTQGKVEFEHASFSYDRASGPLISDLSLTAEPGHTVAIVGPTGAGKTTLVNLIMRFYELDAGRITLDGVDISKIPRPILRANIGMVLQDAWLFHGTIRENIAYGRPTATEAEIHAAAKAAYLDRFVRSLPKGYDTVIDEEGSNVSAGERQLLTIARALLANPALLILDEATSSVDTRTEVLIQRAMSKIRSDRTSFVIAHRLSTIRDADIILFMEKGAIVEHGSHTKLLAARGRYYSLYNAQFMGAKEDITALTDSPDSGLLLAPARS